MATLRGSQSLSLLILDEASGIRYRLEYCGDLAPTNWTLLAPVTLQDNQFCYVDEPVMMELPTASAREGRSRASYVSADAQGLKGA